MIETKESLDSLTVRNSNIDDESLQKLSESIQKSPAKITVSDTVDTIHLNQ